MRRAASRAAVLAAVGALAPSASPAAGQAMGEAAAREDTLPVIALDQIVVTGARAATPLGTSVVALTRLEADDLDQLAAAGFADALRLVPGFALVDFDGTGYDSQLMVRGFYGGGEAEYVVVLLDGRPLNDLQTGLVAWDLVPPVAVASVEVVRGGVSALWGDAAVGGVVNVITERSGVEPRLEWRLEGGGHGAVEGGVRWGAPLGSPGGRRHASVFASGRRQDGFRDHAGRAALTVGGELDLLPRPASAAPGGALSLTALSAWRDIERPGPLSDADVSGEPTASHPFYRFDRIEEWVHRVALDGRSGDALTGSLTAELRQGDLVRTVPLAPAFADTKARHLRGRRLMATFRHEGEGLGVLPRDRLVVGVDASVGDLDSGYRPVVSGPPDAYLGASGEPGALDARGEGSRRAAAVFAQYESTPVPALRLTVGARMDWLGDRHEPRPLGDGDGDAATEARTHRAFSPKAGLNLRYVGSTRQQGHLYLSAGRSFKAPTLDQLYDQRSIPLPVPPFSATTSNAALDPQVGTQVEVGAYHRAILSGSLGAGLSLSVYRMDMEEELDFDVQALRYVNIGRSRHEGLELGLEVSASGGRTARGFANWTLQAATSERGENAGRRLKAIPEHVLSAGLSTTVFGPVEAGLFATRASGAWLDDANTVLLDAWTRIDARVDLDVAGRSVYLEVRNLLDRGYSTTGFPDPSGADVVYYHPAAGRTFSVGIRAGG